MHGALLLVFLVALPAVADTVSSLGNTSPLFSDGSAPTLAELLAAQGGQPAPFDAGIGHELFGPDFTATWTHTYAAIVDPITSASITIGIADHDSQASGSQVTLFDAEGTALTAGMDALFEGSGGGSGEYNVYTLALTAGALAGLADGSYTFQLDLDGPGLQTSIFPPNDVTETGFNAAHLIFATLEINHVSPTTSAVPLPAAGWMGILLLGGLAVARTIRRKPSAT